MLGVILCGGQSSRMGTDKGLLKLQTSTWAQAAEATIKQLGLAVVLSVNEQQAASYAGALAASELVKDNDSIDVQGPLKGVLSIHTMYPLEDLFVLACDMPLMETAVLRQLSAYAQQHPAEAYVFCNQEAAEPLCGIYTAGGLSKILQLQRNQQLAKHSMKYVLEQLHTAFIPLQPDQIKYFRNFNTHAALNGL